VLKGKYGMWIAEGVEEVFEAGDAFFIGPGHTPIIFAGCEIVYFTRTEEANRELPVAMANLMKYLEEQGMEVPAASQPSPQLGRTRRYTGSVEVRPSMRTSRMKVDDGRQRRREACTGRLGSVPGCAGH